jgi:CDP-diacylglycerol--glycerol-3-phosphate 3-phosphatidyltransferase
LLKQLNVADWITLTRLIAIPVVITTTLLNLQNVTGWIIFLALCTDLIDGPIARKFKIESEFGAKLDSIGDASLFLTAFFSIVWFFTAFIEAHLWQTCLLMGLYLFQLVYSLIRFKRLTSYHTYAAKLSAIAAGFFIAVCFFHQPVVWVFYVTWVIGLIEQADEITLMFLLPAPRENVKGTFWVLREKKS